MKKGKEKETICWDCQNCTRCSWADGVPVKGWTATQTIVRDSESDFNSYLVLQCPHYKEDTKRRVTTEDIARIVGKAKTTIAGKLRTRGGAIIVRGWLKENGYKFRAYEITENGRVRREFIIDKLPPPKRH